MPYELLMKVHLATILPAFVLGTILLAMKRKGSPLHRALGKIYMVLMLATAFITLAMPAHVGPTLLGHFGFLHGFSLLALWSVPSAYIAAKKHDVKRHRNAMIGLYVGGILIAGGFTLVPGRYLHTVIFGDVEQTASK
jgi:uncharacterized membrane protein